MKNGHAILAPSGAHCWMNCLAAPFMQKDLPSEDSEYAKEGTLAHAVAAFCLNTATNPAVFVQKPFQEGPYAAGAKTLISAVMAEFLAGYIADISEAAKGKTLFVELQLPIEHITGEPGAYGTADDVILDKETLEIHDLKYGIGVPVSPERNAQLMIYALAAVDYFAWYADFLNIKLVIHQPRVGEGKPQEYLLSREVLETFRARVKKRAGLAWDIYLNGFEETDIAEIFHPGEDECRFCLASGNCKAQTDYLSDIISADFEVLEDISLNIKKEIEKVNHSHPPEVLGVLASNIPFFKDYILALEKKIHTLLASGTPVPGWKIVLGREGNRSWEDEKKVRDILINWGVSSDKYESKVLVSPNQLEQAIGKKGFIWSALEDQIKRAPARPNVVPDMDERELFTPDIGQTDFSTEG